MMYDTKYYVLYSYKLKVAVYVTTCPRVGLIDNYYSESALKKDFKAAAYDAHNNPLGSNYDLGVDGAFADFTVLVGQFYNDGSFHEKSFM